MDDQGQFPIPSWMDRVHQELSRQRHLVLYGNVEDVIPYPAPNPAHPTSQNQVPQDHPSRLVHPCRTYPFAQSLPRVIAELGYRLVMTFDLAMGLDVTTGDREAVEALAPGLSSLWSSQSSSSLSTDLGQDGTSTATDWDWTAGSAGPGTPADGPPGRPGVAGGPVRPPDGAARRAAARMADDPAALEVFMSGALRLLGQSEHSCAIVLNAADLVIPPPGMPDEEQRRQLTYLRHLITTKTVAAGPIGPLRNTVILVAKELSTLPGWAHRANPHVATVAVEPPSLDARRMVLWQHRAQFHGATDLPPEALAQAVESLATLTDGMAVLELESLAPTSRISRSSIAEPRRLVAQYRVGLRRSPWEGLDLTKVRTAQSLLDRRVMGQPDATRVVADMLVNARIGIDFAAEGEDGSTRPKGVFFFVGPTGVGKTELAKAIAELVFEDEKAMARFDMSEYQEEHAGERLTGSPPGYVGHDNGGALTNWALERPFSVILFDEIEKAHPKILDKFLQILDDGRLTDGQGRTAYFSQSVIIFTSNVGSKDVWSLGDEALSKYENVANHFRSAVEARIAGDMERPELLGRLGGSIVPFDILRDPAIRAITGKFLDQLEGSALRQGIHLLIDRDGIVAAVTEVVQKDQAQLGARQIKDPLLQRLVRTPLNRWVLENQPVTGVRLEVRMLKPGEPCSVVALP